MIWVTAALGMGIGAGYEWVSVIACLMILLMLFIFGFRGKLDRPDQPDEKLPDCERFQRRNDARDLKKVLKAHHLKFKKGTGNQRSGDTITGEWFVRGSKKNHLAFISTRFCMIRRSTRFEYYRN